MPELFPSQKTRAFGRAALLCIVPLVAALSSAAAQAQSAAAPDAVDAAPTSGDDQPIPVREIRTFTEVFAKIKEDYV